MSQACVEWHGDIGAYVVGALSPAEAGPVLRHLRGCTGCRADYQDLVPVRDWLGRLGSADGLPARPPLDRLLRQATLRATPTGTQIDLTVSGLPAGQRCILVTVSPAGTAIAGTWTAQYSGTARITGTSAIPRSQLTALRI